MKILKSVTKRGKRIVTLEVTEGEVASGYQLHLIQHGEFYQLGGQINDVVGSHVLNEMRRVYWCSIQQKWAE